MNIIDIKKLYKKAKAAYERRTGRAYTWYMSSAQMAKGTGTICTKAVPDYAEIVVQAERAAARTEAEARKHWRFIEREAAEEAAKCGEWTFWRDDLGKLTSQHAAAAHLGISASYVCRLEATKISYIPERMLERLCSAYDITPDELRDPPAIASAAAVAAKKAAESDGEAEAS